MAVPVIKGRKTENEKFADHIIKNGVKFYNRKEIKDVLAYVRVLVITKDATIKAIANQQNVIHVTKHLTTSTA